MVNLFTFSTTGSPGIGSDVVCVGTASAAVSVVVGFFSVGMRNCLLGT